LDRRSGAEVVVVQPFEDAYVGQVVVTVGDLNGDGVSDLVVTAGVGGGPRVRVFSGVGFGTLVDFFGIPDEDFRGGARASVGDLDGDGWNDLTVAAGPGGGPRLTTWDGRRLAGGGAVGAITADFFAYEPGFQGGVFVTSGDLDGDGRAESIVGAGVGGGPRVRVFAHPFDQPAAVRADFFAADPTDRGGVRVGADDADGDGQADVRTGPGEGRGWGTVYRGRTVTSAEFPDPLVPVAGGGEEL
jgi:hypothetical protein